jgi:hypothetical protein
MADEFIKTSVNLGGNFGSASKPMPVLSVKITQKGVEAILGGLTQLEKMTADSKIVTNGPVSTFLDKRTGLPLAQLDAASGTVDLYKTTKDLAARIDSFMISEKSITELLEKNKIPNAGAQAIGRPTVSLSSPQRDFEIA